MNRFASVLGTVLIATAASYAQTTPAAPREELGPMPRGNAKAKAWNERGWAISGEILENLSADDSPTVRQAEIERVKMLLRARPAFVTKNGTLLGLLLYKKMYAELVDVADYGISVHPESTEDVAQLLKGKAHALSGMGKVDDSLAAAKGYYNVAPMVKTADSLKLLVELLTSKNADLVETFKAEQTAGAEPVAVEKVNEPRPRTGVLESIKVDASPYEKALVSRPAVSFIALTGKGNLLLLADRPSEALKAFESARPFASEKEAAAATENIARAMRAADGSIGRANAWLESLAY